AFPPAAGPADAGDGLSGLDAPATLPAGVAGTGTRETTSAATVESLLAELPELAERSGTGGALSRAGLSCGVSYADTPDDRWCPDRRHPWAGDGRRRSLAVPPATRNATDSVGPDASRTDSAKGSRRADRTIQFGHRPNADAGSPGWDAIPGR